MRAAAVVDALEALERYAVAFDQISAEQRYSASEFIDWVRIEATADRHIVRQPSDAEAA